MVSDGVFRDVNYHWEIKHLVITIKHVFIRKKSTSANFILGILT